MKKAFLSTIAVALLIACEKNDQVAEVKITPSKATLKTGEQLIVSVQNTSIGSISKWSVQPSTGVIIDSVYTHRTNTMRLMQAGTYYISADIRTVHPDCRPSPSWDTCYNRANGSLKVTTSVVVSN